MFMILNKLISKHKTVALACKIVAPFQQNTWGDVATSEYVLAAATQAVCDPGMWAVCFWTRYVFSFI